MLISLLALPVMILFILSSLCHQVIELPSQSQPKRLQSWILKFFDASDCE
jgi:hypothetical protein